MYKMKFHWEKETPEGNKEGSFTVTAMKIEECIKMAEEEIEGFGAELIDYYAV